MTNAAIFEAGLCRTTARPIQALAVCALMTVGLGACGLKSPQMAAYEEPQQAEPASASTQDIDSLIRLGDGLRERGELKTAIAMYQRAAAQSENPEVLVRLGRSLGDFGAYDQAAGAYRRALAQNPDHTSALLGLGTTYLTLGEIDKSVQYLEHLVEIGDGGDPVSYSALGTALEVAGRHDQAVATYSAGLDAAPENLDLKSNLALSYALNDRHGEAIALMSEVTDAFDAKRHHHRNLVLILALAGNDREAVSTGRRLLGDDETRDVLAQATSLRQLSRGAERARALGVG